jgi:peptidoglycan/LPS O-acetylase OafA/YrhL
MQKDSNNSVGYYSAVDFLRGMGALTILVWHYHHFYFEKAYFGPSNGSPSWDFARQPFYEFLFIPYHYGMWAVQFFWMLSGFVFAFVYLKKEMNAKNFFIFRFSRLYPLHLISLLTIAFLQYLSLYALGSFQIIEINDLYHFILNLFFAQYWGLQESYSFNSPSWSVSVEELVYWGFWFIVMKLGINRLRGIFLCTLLAFLAHPIFNIYAYAFYFFFAGVLTYLIHTQLRANKHHIVMVIVSLLVAITVALIRIFLPSISEGLNFAFLLELKGALGNTFFGFFFAAVIFLFAYIDKIQLFNSAQNSFCRYVGSLTYSTYMLHLPFQVLILTIFDLCGFSRQWFDYELVFLVYIISMITIGRYSYVLIEKPSQTYIRKKFTQ